MSKIVNNFGKVIVLEDDLVTSPYFLNYMNDGLNIYENDNQVACIHGYIYPIKSTFKTFLLHRVLIVGVGPLGKIHGKYLKQMEINY